MGNVRASLTRRIVVLGAAAAAALGLAIVSAGTATAEGQVLGADSAGAISDSYIVVLKDTVAATQNAGGIAAQYQGTAHQVWQKAVNGFAVTMSASQARKLAADSRVSYVEQNRTIGILGSQ